MRGGIALLWRKDVDVTLRIFSLNHIDVEVVGGDFNEILADGEKSRGIIISAGLMDNFREGLIDYDLTDLGYTVCPFTWSNG